MFENIYKGKKVLVTGHTGFKGSWLSMWLLQLGADVAGFSLEVFEGPSNFSVLGLDKHLKHYLGDVRDYKALKEVFDEFKPEMVFHLAAQSLVRRSYADPLYTFQTNALGTLNILECIRHSSSVQAVVMITSDKAYRNVEWSWGYRENDTLGGEDPYSASKGCAELIAYSYMHSYFNKTEGPRVATVRAGNVIGGGDWAKDRIVPDCIRAWSQNQELIIRYPNATRPWQHVLEPLSGYLCLGAELWKKNSRCLSESYNFGPDALVNQPVKALIAEMQKHWPASHYKIDQEGILNQPEAGLLKLCCDKALSDLKWHAVLNFEQTVGMTSEWYHHFYNKDDKSIFEFAIKQIADYVEKAKERALPWI